MLEWAAMGLKNSTESIVCSQHLHGYRTIHWMVGSMDHMPVENWFSLIQCPSIANSPLGRARTSRAPHKTTLGFRLAWSHTGPNHVVTVVVSSYMQLPGCPANIILQQSCIASALTIFLPISSYDRVGPLAMRTCTHTHIYTCTHTHRLFLIHTIQKDFRKFYHWKNLGDTFLIAYDCIIIKKHLTERSLSCFVTSVGYSKSYLLLLYLKSCIH